MQEGRKVPSYVNYRDPSIDRRCRPIPTHRQNLGDVTEISDDEDDFSSAPDEVLNVSEDDESLSDSEDIGEGPSLDTVETITNVNVNEVNVEEALVYLRLRPVNPNLQNWIGSNNLIVRNNQIYKIEQNNLIVSESSSQMRQREKHFSFTDIFNGSVQQNVIFERCVQPKIQFEENLTVLTYGTSGSGKTFTLLGDAENPGVIPRALENIFTSYSENIYTTPAVQIKNGEVNFLDDKSISDQLKMKNAILSNINEIETIYSEIRAKIHSEQNNFYKKEFNEPTSILIWMSFVEIYNENVFDLLAPSSTLSHLKNQNKNRNKTTNQELKVFVNKGRTFLKNVTSIFVQSSLEAYTILMNGLKNVSYASTQINDHSSRSHCVLFLEVLSYTRSGLFSEVVYKFCDLAGSERMSKTGNTQKNDRLKESQNINKSLLVLGQCLDIVYKNQQRKNNTNIVPYRNSKLTILLNQALVGKEKLIMIVNLYPTENYYDENLNVLQFASIARSIIYKTPKVNKRRSRFSILPKVVGMRKNELFPHEEENVGFDYQEAYEKLFEENVSLRSQIEKLQYEKLAFEIDIRKELCDKHEQALEEERKFAKQTLDQERKVLNKRFEFERNKLNRKIEKHEETIDELNDEIEKLKNLLKEQNNKTDEKLNFKRRCTWSGEDDKNK